MNNLTQISQHTENTHKNKLLSFILQGLEQGQQQIADQELGDRRSYVGMSDVAKALACLRGAVADKLYPPFQKDLPDKLSETQIKTAFTSKLPQHRGHWQERGLEQAFDAKNAKYIKQLEISTSYKDTPVKAHLDFVLVSDKSIWVVESKCTGNIPKEPYGSHEAQIYGQLGLLHDLWNVQAFSVSSTSCKMTFPELVKSLHNIELPDSPKELALQGWILAMSQKEVEAFGPYTADNIMTNTVLETAKELWKHAEDVEKGITQIDDLRTAFGFYALCDYCAHNSNCTKFRHIAGAENLNALVHEIKKLESEQKQISSQIEERKTELRLVYKNALEDKIVDGRSYILTADTNEKADFRFRVATEGRNYLKKELLETALQNINLSDAEIQDVLEAAYERKACEKLYICKINKSKKQQKNNLYQKAA